MHQLHFDNRFSQLLPGDTSPNNAPRQVNQAVWSSVLPTPVSNPQLIAYAPEVAELLGLSETDITSPQFTQVFAGNQLLAGMQAIATNYGGHQFGNWAGQLGDGRAISLGEVLNAQGQRWELQLKGAGPTPYSRRADGRAVLRSSVREFLCSEAMYHLGIPTTRALSLIATGDGVVRDMFYDGNPEVEAGAIVCRVSPSFIRFGHFELPASRHQTELLGQLVDFTIEREYPELTGDIQQKREQWFLEIAKRTAIMIAHWMRVGFVHGVMNTDNMSILGLTIDYGPYGWLEDYNPMWTPNTTDEYGRRYAYGQQPYIGHWNLARLANALQNAIPNQDLLEQGLALYADTYSQTFSRMLADKFGIKTLNDEDSAWINKAFELMHDAEVDMTLFFRNLVSISLENPDINSVKIAFYREELWEKYQAEWQQWLQTYVVRLQQDQELPEIRIQRMNAANPSFVLRNYLAQQAIDELKLGKDDLLKEIMVAMHHPYNDQPDLAHLTAKRPEWARHKAGCSMLSCSS